MQQTTALLDMAVLETTWSCGIWSNTTWIEVGRVVYNTGLLMDSRCLLLTRVINTKGRRHCHLYVTPTKPHTLTTTGKTMAVFPVITQAALSNTHRSSPWSAVKHHKSRPEMTMSNNRSRAVTISLVWREYNAFSPPLPGLQTKTKLPPTIRIIR